MASKKPAEKPIKLVSPSKVKANVQLKVAGEVMYTLSDFVRETIKAAEVIAKNAGLKTIKSVHVTEAIKAGTRPSEE